VIFYQTLLGAWPLGNEPTESFKQRIKDYMLKAAREAKVHTSWLSIDTTYEEALLDFIEATLDSSDFLDDFLRFQKNIACHGMLNSLAQCLLKITSPGVPDFYQNAELWDLSLVDPDNRRPVDYTRRKKLLDDLESAEIKDRTALLKDVTTNWQDGRIKLYAIKKALEARYNNAKLFSQGDYIPLMANGDKAKHLITFARRDGNAWALTAVPRLTMKLSAANVPPLGEERWTTTKIALPADTPTHWRNAMTGETLAASNGAGLGTIHVHQILRQFPVALLIAV
jgi:(1->4)-alpha-D-glucan 1-alpha-D-glucosylmutase